MFIGNAVIELAPAGATCVERSLRDIRRQAYCTLQECSTVEFLEL